MLPVALALALVLGGAEAGLWRQREELRPIRLEDVDVLVFNRLERATSRAGRRLPRLQDVGTERLHPEVRQIVCRNTHANDRSGDPSAVVWDCSTPDLGRRYRLAAAHVSCEGWDGPGDELVVSGSCVVEYEVERAPDWPDDGRDPRGEEYLYGRRPWWRRGRWGDAREGAWGDARWGPGPEGREWAARRWARREDAL